MEETLNVGRATGTELLMYFAFFAMIAFVIFGIGFTRERDGGSKRTKYFAALPFIFSAWITYYFFKYVSDPVIRDDLTVLNGRHRLAYQWCFPLSVLLLIGIPAISWLLDRNASRNEENY